MLTILIDFVKKNKADIILIIGVLLISLFSFAFGYTTAKREQFGDLKFEINDVETQEKGQN